MSVVGIPIVNVSSNMVQMSLNDRHNFDRTKYSRVLNFIDVNDDPNYFNYDFDIFIEHGDEPITLMQDQTADG